MLRSSSTARTRGRSAGHDIVPASVSIIRPVSPTPWLRRVVEGDSVTEYTYDSFGLVSATNAGFPNPFQFTGRENDGLAGLYYYRARYYSPTLHRFIGEDPFGLASGDINAFAYVLNNPLGFSDPFGLKVVLQTAPVRPPNAEVMSKLEELNRLVPDRDVIITSGSEPRKNPTKDSRHPLGAAADIKIPGLTSAEVAELGAQIGFIGISTYSPPVGTHTHVDVGPRDREWNGHNGETLTYRPDCRINGERKAARSSQSSTRKR